jgi:MoxR-like ATPase
LVEGNAELTPARLVGHFDPALVLSKGYVTEIFEDGPLLSAMRTGALLYIEELNRIPEETINVLLAAMSESEIAVPRLGGVAAAPGFGLVAALNPFDAVGTARISSAFYDRTCRIAMGYQTAEAERRIVDMRCGEGFLHWRERVVELVRRTRDHPDVRVGSSVRGAIDVTRLAAELSRLRGVPCDDWQTGLAASKAALSGRIRLADGCGRTPEEIIIELYTAVFQPPQTDSRSGESSSEPPGER